MTSSRYETHSLENLSLPFIFHPRFTMEGSVRIPNWHKNIEILQCTGGEGFVRCDKALYPLRRHSLVVINSDVLHSIGSDGTLEYRCLILDHEFLISNFIPADQLFFQPLLSDPKLIQSFDAICQSFQQIDRKDFRSVAQLRCDILQFCILLSRFSTPKSNSAGESNYVKDAIRYIRQNLSEPIRLEQLSKQVGVSQFHLARQFKHYTGHTIVQTVNRIRCMEALHLLEQGCSVSFAAEACGFSNHSYFSKTFQSVVGKLPSQVCHCQHASDLALI